MPPWNALLPEDVATFMVHKACAKTVQRMFEEADTDHNSILDANELGALLAGMHKQTSLANKGNATMARDGTEAILKQIEMLDVQKQGGLNFAQVPDVATARH